MDENPIELLHQMKAGTEAVSKNESNAIKAITNNITQVNGYLSRLQNYLDNHPFKDPQSEIHFFKEIKPQFDGELLYHVRLLRLESLCDSVSPREKLLYYQQEQKRISSFTQLNREFYRYHLLGATHLDNYYYLRSQADDTYIFEGDYPLFYDRRYYARMSYKAACIHAFQELQQHITLQYQFLTGDDRKGGSRVPSESLKWTAAKTALVELLYALQEYGVFNNSKPEIKKIARFFQQALDINLDNIYKLYEDMRLRKKGRTPFLDALRNALLRRMDYDDANAL
jgi:hypothetical protein